MNMPLLLASLRNVLGAGLYVFGISQFLNYAGKIFDGPGNEYLAPFGFLLLLSLSVAVMGSLIFGQAVILFLDNKKSESIKAAMYSVGWLFVITLAVFAALIIIK
jgi:hypothetical protein